MYASAKKENNYFGFGTDEKVELEPNFIIIKHAAFAPDESQDGEAPLPVRKYSFPVPDDHSYALPCAKVLGGPRGRAKAFRPSSVVNISGMSYGSLSAPAVEALNRGAALADCLHNTGEGGVSPYHKTGGELVWQIGTGYFGCRAEDGGFSKERFLDTVAQAPVRAVEIKLSQGAKPGLGGLLPAAKVTDEIAVIRGVPKGRDVISPSHHTAFSDVDELLDFVEDLAESTGLPIGIKSAVGEDRFWRTLAREMAKGGRGVDFIAIDGGEGGTGAAPLVFSDHVALPFKLAFTRVYRIFAEEGVSEQVLWTGAGKLGFPETALLAFSFGCDTIAVGREAMMAIGCIQAQRCHTGHCPTGVATQSPVAHAGSRSHVESGPAWPTTWWRCGRSCCGSAVPAASPIPGLVNSDHIEILDDHFGSKGLADVFDYRGGLGSPRRRTDQSGHSESHGRTATRAH